MARLFWYAMMLSVALAAAAGVSWVVAYYTVNGVLGSPPPQMGNQTTTFLWDGMPKDPARRRAWRFSFGPTLIPGAPKVVLYISPLGRLLRLEPSDLPARLKVMHNKGFT